MSVHQVVAFGHQGKNRTNRQAYDISSDSTTTKQPLQRPRPPCRIARPGRSDLSFVRMEKELHKQSRTYTNYI